MDNASDFYKSLGQYAKFKDVSINLVSIKGEECWFDYLMQLSEEAGGGQVDILDSMDIANNFQTLQTNKVIASNVTIKIKLH